MSTNAVVLASAAGTGFFRNRIINGAMVIDQRNGGAAITVNNGSLNGAGCDRWQFAGETSDGVYTAQRLTTTPPTGFTHYTRLSVTTADASIGSSQRYSIIYKLEGHTVADFDFGKSTAKTVTLSFWVRSSVTGTFSGSFRNNAGNRSYPFTYNISSANTWEYKTVTIAGDTTGTWETTTSTGIFLSFDLGSGSTLRGPAGAWAAADYRGATGATSLISTLNATFDITGVQLESGSVATPFEYRPIGLELSLCQRYYETNDYDIFNVGSTTNGVIYYQYTSFNVSKRAAPTVTYNSTFASGFNTSSIGTNLSAVNGISWSASASATTTGSLYILTAWKASAEL